MSQSFNEYSALAFGGKHGGGNPAAVFTFRGGELDLQRAQALARERNLPVSVFLKLDGQTADARFFTSQTELSMCGHGVLPAGAVALQAKGGDASEVWLETQSGRVKMSREGELFALETAAAVEPRDVPDPDELLACFGLRDRDLIPELPFCVASIGSAKALVPTSVDIDALAYAPERLERWSLKHSVNGAYVYRRARAETGADIEARGFNPKTGKPEDAATGVAAGALVGVLDRASVSREWLRIFQGVKMGCPCELFAARTPGGVRVGGRVVMVSKGEWAW